MILITFKCIKKPVTIQAIYVEDLEFENVKNVLLFLKKEYHPSAILEEAEKIVQNGFLAIETLEGYAELHATDYLIRGVEGEYYPCPKDTFESLYEDTIDGLNYIKKPVHVEAVQIAHHGLQEVLKFLNGKGVSSSLDSIVIDNPRGKLTAGKEDFIVKNPDGSYAPVKLRIFNKSYNIVQ